MCRLLLLLTICFASCDNFRRERFSLDDLTYKITSKELTALVQKFDSVYCDHPDAKGRGLQISHMKEYPDSTIYNIGYFSMISLGSPSILCEPINGKPVIFTFFGNNLFSLKSDKKARFNRHLAPDDYQLYLDAVEEARKEFKTLSKEEQEASKDDELQLSVMLDMRSWSVIVRNDDNKIIRVDTTGQAWVTRVAPEDIDSCIIESMCE